jgi:hypothetical protein
VIVPSSEINLIQRGRRKQMMLPLERGQHNELLPCPINAQTCIALQPRPFVKSTKITVLEIEVATVGDLNQDHASKQGYHTVQGVKEAWTQQHGSADDSQPVWVVSFVRGDHSKFYASHAERYLSAKRHDTTTDPRRALHSEPAVTTAEQATLALAATEKREDERRLKLKAAQRTIRQGLDAMQDLDLDDETFKDVRYMRRRLARVEKSLGIERENHDADLAA